MKTLKRDAYLTPIIEILSMETGDSILQDSLSLPGVEETLEDW